MTGLVHVYSVMTRTLRLALAVPALAASVAGCTIQMDAQAFIEREEKRFPVGEAPVVVLTDGSTAWTVAGSFRGSPAVANGQVYAISGSQVKSYNAQTGTESVTYTADAALTSQQPILTDEDLAKIRAINELLDGAFRTATIDITGKSKQYVGDLFIVDSLRPDYLALAA